MSAAVDNVATTLAVEDNTTTAPEVPAADAPAVAETAEVSAPAAQAEAPKPAEADVAANAQAVANNAAVQVEAPKPAEAEAPKSHVLEITSEAQFAELAKTHQYVALQAHASWCGPCKAMAPLFNKHAERLAEYESAYAFARVDIDEVPELAEQLKITTIPAFYFFDADVQPTEEQKKADIRYIPADQCKGAIPPPFNKLVNTYADKAKDKTFSTTEDF